MNWFGKLDNEGGFKGYIRVSKGNVLNVQRAFGRVAPRHGIKDARGYLYGIKRLLPFFAIQGHLGNKASSDGKVIFVNQRTVKPDDLSALQLFSIFASVQLAVGKTYEDTLIRHVDLMGLISEANLQFRCDEPEVVLDVLWYLARVYHVGNGKVEASYPDTYDEIVDRFESALRNNEQVIRTTMKEAA